MLIAALLIAALLITALLIAILVVTILRIAVLLVPILAIPVLTVAAGIHFTHRLVQKAGVMLGMLLEVLERHAVVRKLRVAGKLIILLDDLLRRTAHLAFGAGALEDAVDDVARRAVAVRLRPRT